MCRVSGFLPCFWSSAESVGNQTLRWGCGSCRPAEKLAPSHLPPSFPQALENARQACPRVSHSSHSPDDGAGEGTTKNWARFGGGGRSCGVSQTESRILASICCFLNAERSLDSIPLSFAKSYVS